MSEENIAASFEDKLKTWLRKNSFVFVVSNPNFTVHKSSNSQCTLRHERTPHAEKLTFRSRTGPMIYLEFVQIKPKTIDNIFKMFDDLLSETEIDK